MSPRGSRVRAGLSRRIDAMSAAQSRAADSTRGIEYALQIERGAANNFENVGGSSLLLEKTAQTR